ncbi:MAG TPA: ABC transporter permease subunit, partial [Actinomycetota bacterium]|nr:ABC transporter permease subunit [Actinomycetota bacterium]
MAAEQFERPLVGWALLRRDSSPPAVVAAAVGGVALALVIVGAALVLLLQGITPLESLQSGFRSHELDAVLIAGMVLGLGGAALGSGIMRRMATKVSREEAIAGAVLGGQALALGAFLFWFVNGDQMELFSLNYLYFEKLTPYVDDFVNGAKNTLILAFSSEFFGIILGLILAVFAISKRAVVRAPARVYINFLRGTPLIWQLIFIGIGLPIGLGVNVDTYTAGIIAFSLNAGAYLAEVFR